MSKKNPLIIALDIPSSMKALNLVRSLKVTGAAFKVGFELFSAAGPKIVDKIVSHDVRVFLDLKFHDIPNTVAHAAKVATKMGVWMFNVHASGGSEMMKRAKEASLEAAENSHHEAPILLGVTVLTSTSDLSEQRIPHPVSDQVVHLARLAKDAGLDGVVASAQEASLIRQQCGPDFQLVTPGIRLPGDPADDQKRTTTPLEAIQAGSNYIVVGRPITQADRPLQVIDSILSSLA